jgi:hypothetical protein
MKLSNHEVKALGQALSYAIVYAKTESETAEFALLKVKVEGEIVRREQVAQAEAEHEKMNCPFRYCDSNPKCEKHCRYNSPSPKGE